MNAELDQQVKSADAASGRMNANQMQWPTTAAPAVYTNTPMPLPYTNPPVVLPGDMAPAEPPPPVANPGVDEMNDVMPQAGTGTQADFRTDLSEYHLVLVRDKDVPNSAGYDPRNKLRFFPKGRLPGSSETFYVVTHRFADRAGINAEFRGDVVVAANSAGAPRPPFGTSSHAEKSEGQQQPSVTQFLLSPIGVMVVLLTMVLLFYLVKKNRRDNYGFY